MTAKPKLKYYNLSLPEPVYDEVRDLATAHNTSVLEIFRKFTKLGLIAFDLENSPGAKLIIKDEQGEREIIIL